MPGAARAVLSSLPDERGTQIALRDRACGPGPVLLTVEVDLDHVAVALVGPYGRDPRLTGDDDSVDPPALAVHDHHYRRFLVHYHRRRVDRSQTISRTDLAR